LVTVPSAAVRHRDQILVPTSALEGGPGRHGPERLPGYPGGEIDVVGGEIHHHADIGDARRERTLPASGNLVHLAQLASLQPTAQALQCRVVALDVADRAE
jgi:hypothetical protein